MCSVCVRVCVCVCELVTYFGGALASAAARLAALSAARAASLAFCLARSRSCTHTHTQAHTHTHTYTTVAKHHTQAQGVTMSHCFLAIKSPGLIGGRTGYRRAILEARSPFACMELTYNIHIVQTRLTAGPQVPHHTHARTHTHTHTHICTRVPVSVAPV